MSASSDTLPLAKASRRLRLGLPAHKPAVKLPVTDPTGLTYYERHRTAILARQRAAYQADPAKQRAAVRASQAKLHQQILQTGIMLAKLTV